MTSLRNLAWRHPHWWALALSAAAWAWVVARALGADGHVHGDDAVHVQVGRWLAMVLAMMLPLVTPHLRFAAQRSLWRRRHRAMAGVLAGYVGVWLVASGLAVAAWRSLAPALPSWLPGDGATPWAALLAAAVWHSTPVRRHAVEACHVERPLAPSGWRATRDCVGYGLAVGRRCVVACGGLMVACAALGHGVMPMVAATGLALWERARPSSR